MDWLATLSEFHFLRPLWLLALLPAFVASGWLYYHQKHSGSWEHVISADLLPLLLDHIPVKQRRALPLLALIGWLLGSLAMAGPTWEQTPLPVHKQESALVVLFDLSPSMLVQDIKPNRLTRARLKLIDLLQQRQEGTTALVAYAGEAFIVSPLTDDADTLVALVPALDPNIMPSRGSNVEAAVEQSIELMFNAGVTQGDLLLITDGVPLSARDTLSETIRNMGDFRLSILGVGTKDGAPIPLGSQGFAKNSNGSIVIPRLDTASLKELTHRHGGRYNNLTADDTDIKRLSEGFSVEPGAPGKQLERTFDTWKDQGYWAVLPLLFILLLAFRRGLLACLLITPLLYTPQTSYAFGWEDLWSTPNQQAANALSKGDAETAQERFNDPQWKASAAYRNNDFETAEQLYNDLSVDGHYNRGNALAKAGKLEEAIESYNQALSVSPESEDAKLDDTKFNKTLVEQLLQQQQDSQKNSDQNSEKSDSSQDQQDQQNDSQKSDDQQQSDSQNNEQQEQSSDSDNNPSEDDQPDGKQSEDDPENSQDSDQKSDEQQSSAEEPQNQDEQSTDDQSEQAEEAQQTGEEEQPDDQGKPTNAESQQLTDEEKQAMEQWLRRIPDDPGGLLREKFRYESKKRQYEQRRGINKAPDHDEERW
ncbi:MAG: VWA domain-containing protein [Porticoccus sp.]|nr:VWA domain-containing protein [Porticoccus sp.]MBQ0808302.1 VWA domain-containing protein [Porticoccus sp.]